MQDAEKRLYPRVALAQDAPAATALRLVGDADAHQIVVRNLSPRGMMAVGEIPVSSGSLVQVELGALGWISGAVAWVEADRCGIAFGEDIDPAAI